MSDPKREERKQKRLAKKEGKRLKFKKKKEYVK